MKIGVLGSGDVAKTLAGGFVKHGHQVTIGTRNAAKLADWAKQNAGANVASFADAARYGDIVVLAVKGSAAADALRAVGAAGLDGKTVIDATNPIADAPPDHGVIKFFTTLDDSLMERLQKEFPRAHFVKAFNSVGNAFMVNPQFKGREADHVHLRRQCRRERDGDETAGPAGMGNVGHGRRAGRAGDRAALHSVVHPRNAP